MDADSSLQGTAGASCTQTDTDINQPLNIAMNKLLHKLYTQHMHM